MITPDTLSLPLLENHQLSELAPNVRTLDNGWDIEIYDGYEYDTDLTGEVAYSFDDEADSEELWEEEAELILCCGPTKKDGEICDSLSVYSYLERILPWSDISSSENYHTIHRDEMELALGEELTVYQAKGRIATILESHGCVPFVE